MMNSKNRNIPWNSLSIAKVTITFTIITLTFIDLLKLSYKSTTVYNIHIYTPLLKILTFVRIHLTNFYNELLFFF